jgi:drug/metabolite transporter (DMT)-like permease
VLNGRGCDRSRVSTSRAHAAVGGGALINSASAVLITLAAVGSATTAFYRCLIAVVVLSPFAVRELRRHGSLPPRVVGSALLSGVLLGADFLMWNVSIGDVGAGIATVLVNLQVVVFPLLAAAVARTRLGRPYLMALPVLLAGVALTGGLVDGLLHGGSGGGDPVRGTLLSLLAAVAYSGYLFLNRDAGRRFPAHPVTPVLLAAVAAAATAGVVGAATTGIATHIAPLAWLWLVLLGVFGQALSWVLIGYGLPRVEPAWASTLLLLQPAGAVVLAAAVLGQIPTPLQVGGAVLIIATIWFMSARSGRAPRATSAPGPATADPVAAP